jgi:putative transcriptional regulator
MSTLRHHPHEDALLGYAAGTLDEATSIMVATHLALCPDCRRVVRAAETVGGELIETLTPASRVATSVEDMLNLIARAQPGPDAPTASADMRRERAANSNRADPLLPHPLRGYVPGGIETLDWRWMGPGVRYARILEGEDGAKVGLMRIASGTRMPHHGHTDEEYTMVLAGGYRDGFGSYRRGDVETATAETQHQPIADPDGDCICLVVTRGTLRPTGLFARVLQPLMRM